MSNIKIHGPLRLDLLKKLKLFLGRGKDRKTRPAIYSTRPPLWKNDENPVINLEIPPISLKYDHRETNILQEMMDYFLKVDWHIPFSISGFEFLCEGSSEVHLVFTPGLSNTIFNPATRYLAHPPRAHRQQTVGDASSSVVGKPDHIRAIVERFTRDLKENLKNKIEAFVKKVRKGEQAIIFTDDEKLWRKNREAVIDVTHELPPIPWRYDFKKYNISRDVEDYLNIAAVLEGNPPFYASCVPLGQKDGYPKVHILLSRRKESVLLYLEGGQLPSESGSDDVIMVPVEGESSSMGKTAGSTPILKRVTVQPPIEFMMVPHPATTEEMAVIESRLGADLILNLKRKISLYESRGEDKKHCAVIFTNERVVWRTDRKQWIITNEPFPPIPPNYDHENFNLVDEMIIFLKQNLRKEKHDKEPFNISALLIGKKEGLKLHFIISHPMEEHALFHLDRCLPSHYVSSEVFFDSAFMVGAEFRHYAHKGSNNSFKTNVMVKLRRVSSAPGRLAQDAVPGPSTAGTRGDG